MQKVSKFINEKVAQGFVENCEIVKFDEIWKKKNVFVNENKLDCACREDSVYAVHCPNHRVVIDKSSIP